MAIVLRERGNVLSTSKQQVQVGSAHLEICAAGGVHLRSHRKNGVIARHWTETHNVFTSRARDGVMVHLADER